MIASTFSASAAVDAFTAASALPTILYDLLISGAISAALVPVFSEYAEQDAATLWEIASTIITLALLVLSLLVVLMIWQAPVLISVLAGGFSDDILLLATQMLRWLLPSVVLMGLAGLITALLQSHQRFLLPAFTTSIFNLGIIMAVLFLTARLGPLSMVVGVLLGALLQVLLQLPGLRGMRYRPALNLRHPGVQRILKLYAPVALGISFSIIGIVLDRNLASQVGQNALSYMRYATTLVQLPLGLVAAAVAFAILPTLSRLSISGEEESFRRTLAMGLKVVFLLILPASIGLFLLAQPIIQLLFQRGNFGAQDSARTAWALQLYLPGLPAAALDQILLFAFYARRKTLAPNLVQGAAIACYAISALSLLTLTSLRIEALVLSNSVQWIAHLLILAWLSRKLVMLRGLGLFEAGLKGLLASGMMALVVWPAAQALHGWGPLAQVLGAGLLGATLYLLAALFLRIDALSFFVTMLRQRINR